MNFRSSELSASNGRARRRLSALVAAAALASWAPIGAQTATPSWDATSALLVRTADADRSGSVDGAEWRAFLDGLARTESGAIDRPALQARMQAYLLDADADGSFTRADVEAAFARVDANGDGAASDAELTPSDRDEALAAGGAGGAGGDPPGLRTDAALARAMVLRRADANGDGAVDAQEREAFLGALAEGPIAAERLVAWMDAARAIPPADRNAFTPGVYLVTLDSELDADKSGKLEPADLEGAFARLDDDDSGTVDTRELRPRPRSAGSDAGPGPGDFRRTTETDRARPPLVRWQRTVADALAVQATTGKPLLLCVNMDGESASESLAWLRYREPEFAALTDGFVPLIASPDRHNPRDYDDDGRRIPCPRFGRVVCSEHVDVEPLLFERWFGGRRVAPRHVGVSASGAILFDVFLVQDLAAVDRALREHGVAAEPLADPRAMSESELLESPAAAHREHLEALFDGVAPAERARLAALALSDERATQHPALVRAALEGGAAEARSAATDAVARRPAAVPHDVLLLALREAWGRPGALGALVDALRDVAAAAEAAGDEERARRTRRLRRAFEGLRVEARLVDADRWRLALAAGPVAVVAAGGDYDALVERLGELDEQIAADGEDPELRVLQARTALQCALVLIQSGRDPAFVLQDAQRWAERALEPGRPSAVATALLCRASWLLNEPERALRAGCAALPLLLDQATTPLAAEVLRIVALGRTRGVYAALAADEELPAAWIAEADAAFELLGSHPSIRETDVTNYLDFLGTLEAWGPQARILRAGVRRFGSSPTLHAYLRAQLLRDGGADELSAAYDELVRASGRDATLVWFAGLAGLFTAEREVANRDREAALAAYDECAALFSESMASAPQFASSASHYECLALAGAARQHAEAGALDAAAQAIGAAIEAAPSSAESSDGLGNTPSATARDVVRRLRAAGREQDAQALLGRLAALGLELGTGG